MVGSAVRRGSVPLLACALVAAAAQPALAARAPQTTISSAPPAVTTATTATIAFTSSASGSTFSCRLDGAVAAPCSGPVSYSGLAAGAHTFSVAATAGGLTDASPATASWKVDASPPTTPANLTASTPTSTAVALAWQASTDDTGVVGYDVLRDGAVLTRATGTSWTDATVTTGSTYTYAVRAVDGVGQTSAASSGVTVTAAATAAPDTVLDSGPNGPTRSTSAAFSFHATLSGATFACALDTAKPASCTSPKAYTGLAQGAHAFSVTATANGQVDQTPATAAWSVDTVAPTVPTGLAYASPSPTSLTVTWTASTDAGGVSSYDVYRNGTLLAAAVGTPSYTDGTLVTGTTYKYAVLARDTAGNTSALSAPLLATPTAPYGPHLTRTPYLTDLVGNHVAVSFATDQSAATGSIVWGAVDGSGGCTPTTALAAKRTTVLVGAVSEYQWTAQLDLPASGTYCYRVQLATTDLLGGNPSPRFTTQVPFGSTSPFTFAVLGDWGQVDANGSNDGQSRLLAQLAASGSQFAVTVGDNGYPNGNQQNYGDLQQTGADTSAIFGPRQWTVPGATLPIFTAVGNHGLAGVQHTDITTWTQAKAVADSGGRYQNDVYCCVNGTTSSNYGSEWYAFSAGNARFYVLDSAWGDLNAGTASPFENDAVAHFAPGTPEYTWLVNDLNTHPTQLKFAFSHFPLYVDNPTESSDTFLQGASGLEGVLGSHGVQVVFNGHAHVYERNTASAAGMPITYVTGGGGATLEPIGPCSAYDAYGLGWSPSKLVGTACGAAKVPTSASKVLHFLKVSVSGTTVTVTPTDSDGSTFDVKTYAFKVPPDTYLDSTPPVGTTSGTAAFAFHASGTASAYSCRLDGGTASACTSPKTYTGLAQGSHTFTVAATVNKVVDPTPASFTWTVDRTPPGAPGYLSASSTSPFQQDLSWAAATDSTGVTGYRVYRDGTLLATLGNVLAFSDPVLAASTHEYAVTALDVAGNESALSNSVTATSGPAPSPLFADGFESGDLSAWTSTGGLTVQQATVRSGAFAAEGSTTTGGTFAKKTLPATYADAYCRVLFDVVSTSSQVNLLRLRDAAGASLGYVFQDANGVLGLRNDTLGTTSTSSTVLTPGWHALELRLAADSSAGSPDGALQVWLDNRLVDDLSSTAVDVGAAPVGGLQIGETTTGRTYDVVFDDVAFGTSRLGPQVDLTPPTAPTGLAASATSAFSAALSWTAATDDVGVSGYQVYRDGVLLADAGAATTYTDTSLLPSTTYQYAVRTRDSSGNLSPLTDPVPVTTGVAVTPLFVDGFESGDLRAWTTSNGLTVQSADVRSGTFAAEGSTTTGATYAKKTLPDVYGDGYARVAFLVKSQPSQVNLLRFRTAAGGSLGYAYVSGDGRLGFHDDVTGGDVLSAVVPGPGWHALELRLDVTDGAVAVWLDGVAVAALTGPMNLGTAPTGGFQIGETTTGRTYDVVLDDAAFSTSRIGVGADRTAPTAPTVTGTSPGAFEADLSWTGATDDVGVSGYLLYKDGTLLADVGPATSYSDTTVLAASSHLYAVRARDTSGNLSPLSDPVTVTTAAAAAPLFADGFESGDLSAWTSKGGLTVEKADVRSGTYAAEGSTTAGATYAKKTLPDVYGDGYARVAFLVKSQPSQVNLLRFRTAAGGSLGYAYVSTAGRLGFHDDVTGGDVLSAVVPGPGWHVLELRLDVTDGAVAVWLDGVAVAALTGPMNLGTAPTGAFQIGETTVGRTYDVVFDDAAFSTSRIGLG
jgi:chitodextrinase